MIRSFYAALYRFGIAIFGGRGLSRNPFFRRLHDALLGSITRQVTPESITVHGNVLYLLPGDNMGLSIWGEKYEAGVASLLQNELRPGEVVADVGANIGFFTLVAAGLVGEQGKVAAFEPELVNFELLKKNIAANPYRNITPVRKALSDQAGTISLYTSSHNGGDHATYNRQAGISELRARGILDAQGVYDQHSEDDPRGVVAVEAVTLDEYASAELSGRVDFVKIDVQGYEEFILKGMRCLLSLPTIRIVTEFWPAGMKLAGGSAQNVLDILSASGFSFFLVSDDRPLQPISREDLLARYTIYNNKTTEIFCKKTT